MSEQAKKSPITQNTIFSTFTGNLIKDNSEGLEITWTHYGKVKQINKNNLPLLTFEYDAMGNRLVKENNQTNEKQIYIRDAQGNIMAIYKDRNDSLFLDELHLYGSSRLGVIKEKQHLATQIAGTTLPPIQLPNMKFTSAPIKLTLTKPKNLKYTIKRYNFGKKTL